MYICTYNVRNIYPCLLPPALRLRESHHTTVSQDEMPPAKKLPAKKYIRLLPRHIRPRRSDQWTERNRRMRCKHQTLRNPSQRAMTQHRRKPTTAKALLRHRKRFASALHSPEPLQRHENQCADLVARHRPQIVGSHLILSSRYLLHDP